MSSDFVRTSVTSVLSSLGRPVVFYPLLAKKIGLKEAIFLGQLLYWTPRAHDEDGWVYKTVSEIEDEIMLSPYEQRRVRMNLIGSGILEERYDRLNHRFYYRVIHEAFDRILTSLTEETSVRDAEPLAYPNLSNSTPRTRETSVRYKESETTTETTHRLQAETKTFVEQGKTAPNGATPAGVKQEQTELAGITLEKETESATSENTDSGRNPAVARLIRSHSIKFKAKYGVKLVVAGGKDGKIYKRLLAVHDEKTLLDLQDAFFQSTDAWILQSGHSIAAFAGVINKLVTQGNLTGLSPNLAKTIMALREFVNGSSSMRVIDQEKK